ncbi:hypothetical protein BS50DRAFT_390498 [Corynespora cassiicola Philippines]|uniref:Zn(2)-C6 fungal-type domain-containing protein n=1 Tax=Corynespora cassiicola Philippines TaxID=1448308 RepID=A0A2T2NQ41_CORCC|nr:hypothetical protein BS50DRAFT_390498 [Corynespora cassiicola Philippines]
MLPHNLTGDISMARANGPALHQYACLRCRARRVKCDKTLSGCANCAGHEAQCIYSARRPRKPQKAHQDQQAAQRTLLPSLVNPSSIHSTVTSRADSLGSELVSDHHSGTSEQSDDDDEDAFLLRELRDTGFQPREDATKTSLGRLLVGPNGESHYIDGEKIQQVAYLETVLAAESPDIKEGAPRTPRRRTEKLDADSLLNASFDGRDLRLYHPPSGSMHALWDFYCRNVDGMAKVLYKPDVKGLITRAATNLSSIDSSTEAPLLFAIW